MTEEDIYNQIPSLFANDEPEPEPEPKDVDDRPKRKSSAKRRKASKAKEEKRNRTSKGKAKKKAPAVEENESSTNAPQEDVREDTAPLEGIETASESQDATLETSSSDGGQEDPSSEEHPEDEVPFDIEPEPEPVIDESEGGMVTAFVGEAPIITDDDGAQPEEDGEEKTEDGPEEEPEAGEVEINGPIEYTTDDGDLIHIRPAVSKVDQEDDERIELCSMCGLPINEPAKMMRDAEDNPICYTCIRSMMLQEREEPEEEDEAQEEEEAEEVPGTEEVSEPCPTPVQPLSEPEGEPDEDAGSEDPSNPVQPLSEPEEEDDEEEEEPQSGLKGIFAKLRKRDEEIRAERQESRKLKKHKRDDNCDPDQFSEKLRRWYLWRFKGYVKLRTLTRLRNGEYKLETNLIKRSELPRDAVACTGEKGFYCNDTIVNSDWYLQTHVKKGLLEDDFTASDACNYMLTNKIDNALAVNWTDMNHVDFTKIAMIVGVVLVVALIVITRM